jgi:hypothetical protein
LQVNKGEARGMPWFKLHQDINIALGGEIIPQDGAEQGQLANVVLLAELGNLRLGDRDRKLAGRGHGASRQKGN